MYLYIPIQYVQSSGSWKRAKRQASTWLGKRQWESVKEDAFEFASPAGHAKGYFI